MVIKIYRRSQAPSKYLRQCKTRLAEDYVLNEAYDCKEPHLFVMVGKFFLESFNADVEYALGRLKTSTELNQKLIDECDEIVKNFIKNRKHLYPSISRKMRLSEKSDCKETLHSLRSKVKEFYISLPSILS